MRKEADVLSWRWILCSIKPISGIISSRRLQLPPKKKKDQELNSLLRIDDSFQKLVVVKDDILPWTDEHGISYINVQDFLLDAIDRL